MSGPVLTPVSRTVSPDTLTVGKVQVPGVGLRVGMQMDGRLTLMSPAKARRVAADFESARAKELGVDWVAGALRACAAEVLGLAPPA